MVSMPPLVFVITRQALQPEINMAAAKTEAVEYQAVKAAEVKMKPEYQTF